MNKKIIQKFAFPGLFEAQAFVHNFEMHCDHEKPLSSDKDISSFYNKLFRKHASGKLYTCPKVSISSALFVLQSVNL